MFCVQLSVLPYFKIRSATTSFSHHSQGSVYMDAVPKERLCQSANVFLPWFSSLAEEIPGFFLGIFCHCSFDLSSRKRGSSVCNPRILRSSILFQAVVLVIVNWSGNFRMHLSRLQFSKGVTFAEILLDLSSERIGALGVMDFRLSCTDNRACFAWIWRSYGL